MSELGENAELVALYLSESEQLLNKFERALLDADRAEALEDPNELFRLMHTLKGSSAMMEYAPLVDAAHGFEDVLAVVRRAERALADDKLQALIDAGLAFTAYFQSAFDRIRAGSAPISDAALSREIEALAASLGVSAQVAPSGASAQAENAQAASSGASAQAAQAAPLSSAAQAENAQVASSGASAQAESALAASPGEARVQVMLKPCPMPHMRAFIIARAISKLCARLRTVPEKLEGAADRAAELQREGFEISFAPAASVDMQTVIEKIAAQPYVSGVSLKAPPKSEAAGAQSVSVAQSSLNALIGCLGEIATTQVALEACAAQAAPESKRMGELLVALRRAVAEANLLAAGLGARAVGDAFAQVQRAVRGMAKDLGKAVRVQTVGADVRVDKSVLEVLSDSLIHIVRNAVDHGIEMPDERLARGKDRTGLITLSAVKKNDYLNVSVTDDGEGIQRRAVLERARQLGRLTKPEALYSDDELGELLLSSGISTSASVTRYSGRGVGLDAVARRVRQAGGRVSIESREGRGTRFNLKIPITLLIVEGIEIKLESGEALIVPTVDIRHILAADQIGEQIDYLGERCARLRFPGEAPAPGASAGYALLLERDFGRRFMRAAALSAMTSYYVKPMPEYVANALGRGDIYSGCALCADGELRCILDVGRLVDASERGDAAERQNDL